MSDSTADILTKLGGYHIEKRGERQVKVHNRREFRNMSSGIHCLLGDMSYTCIVTCAVCMCIYPKMLEDLRDEGERLKTQLKLYKLP